MGYEQVRTFYPREMGTQKGWCLKNARVGFRIYTAKFSSAKADMLSQKKNGTLHPMSTLPANCAVPVYIDTSSSAEHVEVCDKGIWYSDGKKVSAPNFSTCFGWGELCDGTRVVKLANPDSFLPSKGYWREGDKDLRIGKLAQFMYSTFPAYTSKKALGNYYGYYIKNLMSKAVSQNQIRPKAFGKRVTCRLQQIFCFIRI